MFYRLRFLYHARKPRVLSQANKSYIDYTKKLREARRQVHFQAKQYQNKIEDQFLAKHHEEMKRKHFEHQCSFRKQIFVNAFRLHQNQAKWRLQDDEFTSRLNKHLHEEDIRKINRSRILKIMEHESANYWFNQDNVDKRLKEQTIFPEYIASTEYYYKLFAEALAYEFGDFNEVHSLTSNEQIIKQKNKLLIPLYMQLRNKISAYKRNQIQDEVRRHSFAVEKLRNSKQLNQTQLKVLIEKENAKSEQIIKQIQEKVATPESKINNLKKKVIQLVSIFKTWKQYTNVIGLTSAQVIKNQNDSTNEINIQKAEKQVLKTLKDKETETFISSIEEDTEEQDITFEQYVSKIKGGRLDSQVAQSSNVSLQELDNLLQQTGPIESSDSQTGTINVEEVKRLNIGDVLSEETSEKGNESTTTKEKFVFNVNPEFLNVKQTSTSVQILKEYFKDDTDFIHILNQLGEIDVRYPKLFETVWESIDG